MIKKINISLWTDSKIIFIVSSNWKTGDHKIWIEKQISWGGKNEIAKNQVFKIIISPIQE